MTIVSGAHLKPATGERDVLPGVGTLSLHRPRVGCTRPRRSARFDVEVNVIGNAFFLGRVLDVLQDGFARRNVLVIAPGTKRIPVQ